MMMPLCGGDLVEMRFLVGKAGLVMLNPVLQKFCGNQHEGDRREGR